MNISRSSIALAAAAALSSIAPSAMACSPKGFGYIGSMSVFAGNYAIRDCAKADGSLLPISQYTALFSILGTTFGGDGRTTFALPDTRGRTVVGAGDGPGRPSIRWGQTGGAPTVTLSVTHLPAHSHTATTTVEAEATAHASSTVADTANPNGNVWAVAKKGKPQVYNSATPDVSMHAGAVTVDATASTTVANTGDGQAFSVQDPYVGMFWLIQLDGIFPPRS